MKTARYIDVTLSCEVHDIRALIRAARKRAMAELDLTPEEAKEGYNAHTLDQCARLLLDPGVSPPGLSIQDSTAEEYTTWA